MLPRLRSGRILDEEARQADQQQAITMASSTAEGG
jgi:hypothetical protein